MEMPYFITSIEEVIKIGNLIRFSIDREKIWKVIDIPDPFTLIIEPCREPSLHLQFNNVLFKMWER